MAALAAARGLDNLVVLPLQPIERLREVLATADVAVSVIEPDAGAFSVPSKVQSYLCAGRAVLLAAPAANLAVAGGAGARARAWWWRRRTERGSSRRRCGSGPTTPAGWRWARAGGAYAERTYDVERVADRFEEVLEAARARRMRAG